MFIEQRHQEILDMLAEQGSVTTKEITEAFKISYDSAKRDLRILEEKGLLKRTYGGAIPLGELAIGRPKSRRMPSSEAVAPEIMLMAQTAVSLIKERELVFIFGDNIGVQMAKMLPQDKKIRVVTNSVRVAEVLRLRGGIDTIVVGGMMGADGCCCDGFAVDMIHRLRIDRAFISSDGISPRFGLSTKDPAAIPFITALMDASKTSVGVYEAVKFDAEGDFSICPSSRLDIIVTDSDEETADGFTRLGTKLISCKNKG